MAKFLEDQEAKGTTLTMHGKRRAAPPALREKRKDSQINRPIKVKKALRREARRRDFVEQAVHKSTPCVLGPKTPHTTGQTPAKRKYMSA